MCRIVLSTHLSFCMFIKGASFHNLVKSCFKIMFVISIFLVLACFANNIFGIQGLYIGKLNTIKRVIIDVDSGVDDYQALSILLVADKIQKIKIEAITCTDGNTNLGNVERNVIRLLEIVGRTDIPVYSGSFQSILDNNETERFYGQDGFGDLILKKEPDLSIINKTISPTFINEIVSQHPGEITIVGLAGLTNIALAMRMYPDVQRNIKEVFAMGGNFEERKKEFNFHFDPEAANIVIAYAEFPITLLPWRGCVTQKIFMDWRFGINMTNPVWNIMERAERNLFGQRPPGVQYVSCDPILAAILLDETLITESKMANIFVELHDLEFRSEIRVNENGIPNVRAIINYHKERYQKLWIDTFYDICKLHSCLSSYE